MKIYIYKTQNVNATFRIEDSRPRVHSILTIFLFKQIHQSVHSNVVHLNREKKQAYEKLAELKVRKKRNKEATNHSEIAVTTVTTHFE